MEDYYKIKDAEEDKKNDSPAKVFGDSGMRGCDFCGSSGRALYQDKYGQEMTGRFLPEHIY